MSARHTLRRMPGPWRLAAYAVLAVAAVVTVAPFLYVLSASLKDQTSLFSYPPELIPSPIDFDNYSRLFSEQPFLRWTLNTLLVAGTITVVKLVLDSMSAFALIAFDFRGKRALYGLMLSTIMMPIGVLIVPLYFIVRDLGWLDTYWALIVPPLASPVGLFMLRAFMQQVPDELIPAARLDNCSSLGIYARIVMPLIRPGLAVVGIYLFIAQYTSFIWPLIAVGNSDLFVLTTGLSSITPDPTLRDYGLITTAMCLTLVPITFVFLLFQRRFLSVSLTGAIKG